jgi:acetaldehyde dehydrogenase
MQLVLLADRDADSSGLRCAREQGIATSGEGVEAILADTEMEIVFDATDSRHRPDQARILRDARRCTVDLTSRGAGSAAVLPVSPDDQMPLDGQIQGREISLLGCPAQAVLPLVRTAAGITPLVYAESVSVMPGCALGTATREGIDEMIGATARGLTTVAHAGQGKAIVAVSPAEPPARMRNIVHLIPEGDYDWRQLNAAVEETAEAVGRLVPGYRLCGEPCHEERDTPWDRRTTIRLVVEVAGDGRRLPAYAGSIEIMTAAAQAIGEQLARAIARDRLGAEAA